MNVKIGRRTQGFLENNNQLISAHKRKENFVVKVVVVVIVVDKTRLDVSVVILDFTLAFPLSLAFILSSSLLAENATNSLVGGGGYQR